MAEIAKFPYFEVQFTKDGAIHDSQEAKSAVDGIAQNNITDLFAFSHGWNNDMGQARTLFQDFFTSVKSLRDGGHAPSLSNRKFAVLGILWPSKKFADEDLIASGAASLDGVVGDVAVSNQLDTLIAALDTPKAGKRLEEAKDLLADLESDPQARDAFVEKIRSLLPAPAKDEEVANEFFTLSGDEIMNLLNAPLVMPGATDGGGAAGLGDEPAGGAAGLGDFFSGIKAAALRVANYATYYLMKERAGKVGRDGVSKVIGQILEKTPELKVHFIGHSFGGRVVTAAAHVLGDKPATRPSSMSLLQAAFSHNGFAEKFDGKRDGFFRKVVTGKKVNGPIVVTHTKNDRAVGLAYPIASKLAGQDASALGDANDRFGGLGRNGAQHTPEAVTGTLLPVGGAYSFQAQKVFNLEATQFIKDHGAVSGKEPAAAVLAAVAAT
jgi:hypothetical protein